MLAQWHKLFDKYQIAFCYYRANNNTLKNLFVFEFNITNKTYYFFNKRFLALTLLKVSKLIPKKEAM